MTAVLGFLVILIIIVILGAIGLLIASEWIVLRKAGRPGWAILIPFYGTWVMSEVGGKPGWWGIIAALDYSFNFNNSGGNNSTGHIPAGLIIVLAAVGVLSFIFNLLISIGMAHNFGKSTTFGFLIGFIPFIGYPILAFGSAQYMGAEPVAPNAPTPPNHDAGATTAGQPVATAAQPQPYKASEDDTLKWVVPIGRSGWAIAAGYLGLFAVLIVPAPLALLTGILGLRAIKKHPEKLGKGRAWFGIIAGAIGTAVIMFVIVANFTRN